MPDHNAPTEPPAPCPDNPGIGHEAQFALAGRGRESVEEVNTVDLAATVLKARGYKTTNCGAHLLHAESGFVILPQLVSVHPLDDGGVQTVTTVQVNHPAFAPAGVFEYQHSTGDTLADSLCKGFDVWVRGDFMALLDALEPVAKACPSMVLDFPAREGEPARARRAVLGPVAHYMSQPPQVATESGADEHPFCPCCLLTRSFEAFRPFLEGHEVACLRLFAMRNSDGEAEADCRINGAEYEPGKAALREYVATWPDAGVEFRKQYVVLHNYDKPAGSE